MDSHVTPAPGATAPPGLNDLRADCSRCAALCCVAMSFGRSADFAIDKPAGVACPNLGPNNRCTIHTTLRTQGFAGCVAFDCCGAGQRITQLAGPNADWRSQPQHAAALFAAFHVMLALHEMLWYLAQAAAWTRPQRQDLNAPDPHGQTGTWRRGLVPAGGAEVPDEIGRSIESWRLRVTQAAHSAGRSGAGTGPQAGGQQRNQIAPGLVSQGDLEELRAGVGNVLAQVSAAVRGGVRAQRRSAPDLAGARLRGADLSRRDLRGGWLMGADLRGADLTRTDVLGADLRGADLRGAKLRDALFLTTQQVAAAQGDTATTLPPEIPRPPHWHTP